MTIREVTIAAAEALTGFLSSDRADNIRAVGQVVQGAVRGRIWSAFTATWKRLREEGRIPDDYVSTPQCEKCMLELIESLTNDMPDADRLTCMSRIFLAAATESIDDRESVLATEYMKMCRQLEAGEILILRAAYTIGKSFDGRGASMIDGGEWARRVAGESPLRHEALVNLYERRLSEKCLIHPRRHPNDQSCILDAHYRLTSFGLGLCRYIEAGENVDETSPSTC